MKSEKLEAELRDLRLNKERELEEHRKRAIVLESVAAEAKEESLHLSSEKMNIAEEGSSTESKFAAISFAAISKQLKESSERKLPLELALDESKKECESMQVQHSTREHELPTF